MDLNTLPLDAQHHAAGARMVPFGGWSMPVQYTSILAEHRHTRMTASIFDCRQWGNSDCADRTSRLNSILSYCVAPVIRPSGRVGTTSCWQRWNRNRRHYRLTPGRDLAVYLQRELGMPDSTLQGSGKAVMARGWKQFRKVLLGAPVQRGNFSRETLAELLDVSNKPLELDWSDQLQLKVRFVTKGVCRWCDRGIF